MDKIHTSRGFTLLEMLIVTSIIITLGGALSFIDINTYRGDALRAERDTIITSLQTARADALNNINQKAHGVAIHPDGYDGYVIFEGDTYASSTLHTAVPASYHTEIGAETPPEIVFLPLSGNAIYAGAPLIAKIVLVDNKRLATSTISINHEGAITY